MSTLLRPTYTRTFENLSSPTSPLTSLPCLHPTQAHPDNPSSDMLYNTFLDKGVHSQLSQYDALAAIPSWDDTATATAKDFSADMLYDLAFPQHDSEDKFWVKTMTLGGGSKKLRGDDSLNTGDEGASIYNNDDSEFADFVRVTHELQPGFQQRWGMSALLSFDEALSFALKNPQYNEYAPMFVTAGVVSTIARGWFTDAVLLKIWAWCCMYEHDRSLDALFSVMVLSGDFNHPSARRFACKGRDYTRVHAKRLHVLRGVLDVGRRRIADTPEQPRSRFSKAAASTTSTPTPPPPERASSSRGRKTRRGTARNSESFKRGGPNRSTRASRSGRVTPTTALNPSGRLSKSGRETPRTVSCPSGRWRRNGRPNSESISESYVGLVCSNLAFVRAVGACFRSSGARWL